MRAAPRSSAPDDGVGDAGLVGVVDQDRCSLVAGAGRHDELDVRIVEREGST
jgi:hypothetical protein